MAEWHQLMGGKVHVRKRAGSNLGNAIRTLRGANSVRALAPKTSRKRWPSLRTGISICAAKRGQGCCRKVSCSGMRLPNFSANTRTITNGERSAAWVKGLGIRLRLHLRPFFDLLPISDITAGKVQEYRADRIANPKPTPNQIAKGKKDGKPPKATPPSRSTLHDEIVTLRLVLKTAHRHRWLESLPDLSPRINNRARSGIGLGSVLRNTKRCTKRRAKYAKKTHHDHYKWNAEQVARLRAFSREHRLASR